MLLRDLGGDLGAKEIEVALGGMIYELRKVGCV